METENTSEKKPKESKKPPAAPANETVEPTPKKGPGAPSTYTKEIAEEICWRLAQGQTLKSICMMNHMPCITTVFEWETKIGEFAQLSARAREHGTHVLADQCIEIADDPLMDPADKRVRIDTRIRLIGKWNAKRYGDKIEHEVKTDFIPLDELQRRIAESEARRGISQPQPIVIEDSKIITGGQNNG